ncbi:MAG: hypothetical protein J2P50_08235 [Hyphomicrobiaceae bacterium]|nr:hypothetical protein [Hyphomicrobiaceae bacterium]
MQFIYVWPSRDLIAGSWSWPVSWHDAFQDAASRVGLAVALYVLDGHRITTRPISLELSIGSIEFRVRRRGGSLYITVVAFTGPDHPPDLPDGQPSAVEGLILGLHGSGEGAYFVVFHGNMPSIPAGTSRREERRQILAFGKGRGNTDSKRINTVGHLASGGSARDMEIVKAPGLVDGTGSGRRARATKRSVTVATPRCDWTKTATLASLEMKNGCLAHLGLNPANLQPILVYVNRGSGKSGSRVWRLLDEKHLLSHVLSKRLH